MAENGEVLTWSSDSATIPELFVKGHGNLGKTVAKLFEDSSLHWDRDGNHTKEKRFLL